MGEQIALHALQQASIPGGELCQCLHDLYVDMQFAVDAVLTSLWELEIRQALLVGDEEPLHRLQVACRCLVLPCLLEDESGQGTVLQVQVFGMLLQYLEERVCVMAVRLVHLHAALVEYIEVAERGRTERSGTVLTYVAHGILQDVLRRLSREYLLSGEEISHLTCQVVAALHARVPGEGTVRLLESAQFVEVSLLQ